MFKADVEKPFPKETASVVQSNELLQAYRACRNHVVLAHLF
jgi:hypothetical protein